MILTLVDCISHQPSALRDLQWAILQPWASGPHLSKVLAGLGSSIRQDALEGSSPVQTQHKPESSRIWEAAMVQMEAMYVSSHPGPGT